MLAEHRFIQKDDLLSESKYTINMIDLQAIFFFNLTFSARFLLLQITDSLLTNRDAVVLF